MPSSARLRPSSPPLLSSLPAARFGPRLHDAVLPGPATRKTHSVQVPYAHPQLVVAAASPPKLFICSLPCRLDLVPINRSVGLKAKPTKPVTEVLRPVVAKYGLHLSNLVARIVSTPTVSFGSLCMKDPHHARLVFPSERRGGAVRSRPSYIEPGRITGSIRYSRTCPLER